jgi:hypothetical protein
MKRHRTDEPPAGAFIDLRNVRLYGDADAQVAGAALAARGTPNPNRAMVRRGDPTYRTRVELARAREQAGHAAGLQRAQVAMLEAQRAVRAAKAAGQDYKALAATARDARARYIALTGGMERREVAVAQASDANKVKAV